MGQKLDCYASFISVRNLRRGPPTWNALPIHGSIKGRRSPNPHARTVRGFIACKQSAQFTVGYFPQRPLPRPSYATSTAAQIGPKAGYPGQFPMQIAPSSEIHWIRSKQKLIRRVPAPRARCIQAPLNVRSDLLPRKTIPLRRSSIQGRAPTGRHRNLIHPHLISPFPSFIHLDALRSAKNSYQRIAKDAPHLVGVLRANGYPRAYLEKTPIAYKAITSSENSGSTRNFSLNIATVEVPAIGICGAL